MYKINISKSEIRKRAYLFSAAKSRFVGKDRTNQELYTLDMEDDLREASAQLSGDIGGILITEADIPNSTSQKVVLRVLLGVNNSNQAQTDWAPVLVHLDGVILAVPVSYGQMTDGGTDDEFNAKQIADFFISHEETGWVCSRVRETVTLVRSRQSGALDELTTYVDGMDLNGMEIECTLSSTSDKAKIATLSYDLIGLKEDIIALTRQKGRNMTDKNGVSIMDKIAFSAGESSSHTVNTDHDNIFTLCKHLSARKAKIISAKNEGVAFDTIVMNDDDSELFDSYYSRAFSDMLAELAVLISEYEDGESFTLTAGFPGSVGGSIASNVEQYLFSHVMGQFYAMCGLPEDSKTNKTDAFEYIITVKNLLSAQADSAALLKNIINDAAAKVQTSLYPLSKRTLGTMSTYKYDEQAKTIEFYFELKELPISSSAVQLVYSICRSIIVNGALSKWYTMANITDDKNEAKAELEMNITSLSYVIEDRLRFIGLFDQLFLESIVMIRQKMLGYTKNMEESDFEILGDLAILKFIHADWEASADKSINYMSLLTDNIKDAIYRYVLKEWWRISDNKEFEADFVNFQNAINAVEGSLSRRRKPVIRPLSWF